MKTPGKPPKNQKTGFTLIEVLVIVFVAAIFSVLLLKTFQVISQSTYKLEEMIHIKNTVHLVFEYYRALPYNKLNYCEEQDVTNRFIARNKVENLKLFITIKPIKQYGVKEIALDVKWGRKKNPYKLKFKTLKYKNGL